MQASLVLLHHSSVRLLWLVYENLVFFMAKLVDMYCINLISWWFRVCFIYNCILKFYVILIGCLVHKLCWLCAATYMEGLWYAIWAEWSWSKKGKVSVNNIFHQIVKCFDFTGKRCKWPRPKVVTLDSFLFLSSPFLLFNDIELIVLYFLI